MAGGGGGVFVLVLLTQHYKNINLITNEILFRVLVEVIIKNVFPPSESHSGYKSPLDFCSFKRLHLGKFLTANVGESSNFFGGASNIYFFTLSDILLAPRYQTLMDFCVWVDFWDQEGNSEI